MMNYFTQILFMYLSYTNVLKVNLPNETSQQICNYRCTYASTNFIIIVMNVS